MLFDEFYFHERRGLPRWERLGHPIDTLSVLAVYFFTIFAPYESSKLPILIGLAAFSCVLITKDEWVHRSECSGSEHWLHALLFILHPLSFLSAGHFWISGDLWPLQVQAVIISLFLLYQITRWNLWALKK